MARKGEDAAATRARIQRQRVLQAIRQARTMASPSPSPFCRSRFGIAELVELAKDRFVLLLGIPIPVSYNLDLDVLAASPAGQQQAAAPGVADGVADQLRRITSSRPGSGEYRQVGFARAVVEPLGVGLGKMNLFSIC